MSDFLTRYERRFNFWGEDSVERHKEIQGAYFDDLMKTAPNKMYIGGAAVGVSYVKTHFGYNEATDFLLTPLIQPLPIGTITKDGNNDSWLVAAEDNLNPAAYNRYKLLKCTDEIGFKDKYGQLLTFPCLIYGSQRTKIQEVFRLKEDLVLPQDRSTVLIILPIIDSVVKGLRVVLGRRVWKVTYIDELSVKDIMFVTLQVDQVDEQADNIQNKIADNKKDIYTLQLFNNSYEKIVGEIFSIDYVVYKNGLETNIPCDIISSNVEVVSTLGNSLEGLGIGEAIVTVSVRENPLVKKEILVKIVQEIIEEEISYEILGNENIKWGQSSNYRGCMHINGVLDSNSIIYTIIDTQNLVTYETNGNVITINAKSNNVVGEVLLKAKFSDNVEINKLIKIVSLWS